MLLPDKKWCNGDADNTMNTQSVRQTCPDKGKRVKGLEQAKAENNLGLSSEQLRVKEALA